MMIVRGELTIIDYHAPFDQGFIYLMECVHCHAINNKIKTAVGKIVMIDNEQRRQFSKFRVFAWSQS